MIFLDNTATTHKKPKSVVKALKLGVTKYSVNAGRGGYPLCIKAGQEIFRFRNKVSNFFNLNNPCNVIITKSCTESVNLALRGSAKANGHIITTVMEHNSVLRTIDELSTEQNIEYTLLKPNTNGTISPTDLENRIKPNTYLVCIIHTSNVTGATNNIKEIGNICKKHNLLFFVDGAQSAGHNKIDMQEQNINMLALAGHKGLYGPQGIGLLLFKDVQLKPLITGGTGTSSESIKQPTEAPEGLESGTPNMPCILGLNAGIDFVERNFEKINKKIHFLTKYLLDNLENNPLVKLYSNNYKSGVVSFSVLGKSSTDVAEYLNEKYDICIRSGLHCAPLIHKNLGTLNSGLNRIGISYFNSLKDIKTLITALENMM